MALKLCLVIHVSYQTIVTVTFNMLFHDGKLFYRSQKDHNIINLCLSMALKLLIGYT